MYSPNRHAQTVAEVFLSALLMVGAVTLLGTDRPLHAWSGLDFHYLSLPLVLVGALLFLGRTVQLLRATSLGSAAVPRVSIAGSERVVALLPLAERLLTDAAKIAMVWGLLASVSQLPITVAGHPNGLDVASLARYLLAFDSLAVWSVLLLAPFAVMHSVSWDWQEIARFSRLPASRLFAFGVAYVLLADGGMLAVALDLSGTGLLLGLGFALALSWAALLLRGELGRLHPPRLALVLRIALPLAEAGWVIALLGAVAALPSVVEAPLAERFAGDRATLNLYLDMVRALVVWSMVGLAPFAMARAASTFWPVAALIGFPIQLLAWLAALFVVFSGNGILSNSYGIDGARTLAVLALSILLLYFDSVVRNAGSAELPHKAARAFALATPAASVVAAGLVPAMVIWTVLDTLPALGAVLLQHEATRAYGEQYATHLAGFAGIRNAGAALCLALGLGLALPASLGVVLGRYRLLASAASCTAAGFLAWLAGAQLSHLHYMYALAGVVCGTGLFAVALSQLAGYATSSSHRIVAEVSAWLFDSRVRGFFIGASIAVYGVFLHPLLNQLLRYAALYEYMAVLALALFILWRVRKGTRRELESPDGEPPAWERWSHHEQRLETKVDPRASGIASLQGRFLEHGEWRPVLSYLMTLLYRNGAPFETVEAVCRRLRLAAFAPAHFSLPGEAARVAARRRRAIEEAIALAEEGIASQARKTPQVDEHDLKQLADAYVETGDNPERLVAMVLQAHVQRGDSLVSAIELWFPVIRSPDPSPKWYEPPWVRSRARARSRSWRTQVAEQWTLRLLDGSTSPADGPSALLAGKVA